MTLIWVFHYLAHLPSRFCQIPISPGRFGQTVEHSKFKSTQPSPRADEFPCTCPCVKCTFFTENLSCYLKRAYGCCEPPDTPPPPPPPAPTAAPLPDCECNEPGASCDPNANPATFCSASYLGLTAPTVQDFEGILPPGPMICNYWDEVQCCVWISAGCTQDSDCCNLSASYDFATTTCNNNVCCMAAGGICQGNDDECCGSLTCTEFVCQ